MRVLIIEDSAVNMMLTVAMLENAGHVAVPAENAAQGLELAYAQRPDVVLMDVRLPDTDGVTATRVFKADPKLADIPVIALTASTQKEDEDAMRAAGCEEYVTKPIHYVGFMLALERVAERHRATVTIT